MALFFLPVIIFLFSCKKQEDRTCIKSEGESISKTILLDESVTTVRLYDDVHLVLIEDSLTFVEIRAGKNMINHIEVLPQDTVLELRNNSKCYFLREFKHEAVVYLHSPDIREFHMYGFGTVKTETALVRQKFSINSWNSASIVDVELISQYFYCGIHAGAADITIRGKSHAADLYSASYGMIDATQFEMKNTYIDMQGSGDCSVNTIDHLYGYVKGSGSTYYLGEPRVDMLITGRGEVKPLTE